MQCSLGPLVSIGQHCRFLFKHKVCTLQTWPPASQPRPVDARESEGPHPGGTQVCAWEKPGTHDPPVAGSQDSINTLRARTLSLNCLFGGRNINQFDLCRHPRKEITEVSTKFRERQCHGRSTHDFTANCCSHVDAPLCLFFFCDGLKRC